MQRVVFFGFGNVNLDYSQDAWNLLWRDIAQLIDDANLGLAFG